MFVLIIGSFSAPFGKKFGDYTYVKEMFESKYCHVVLALEKLKSKIDLWLKYRMLISKSLNNWIFLLFNSMYSIWRYRTLYRQTLKNVVINLTNPWSCPNVMLFQMLVVLLLVYIISQQLLSYLKKNDSDGWYWYLVQNLPPRGM